MAIDEKSPKILDLPIGLKGSGQRKEFDSLGTVMVPANRYWGAQTQRSLIHFNIGHDRMPHEVYHAYGYVKKAAAIVNTRHDRLPVWKGTLIERVCDEVISGALDQDFPLYVWQTGSGTQSNMNVNEVVSNRCIQLVGGKLGSQEPIHPNDHVNMGQSSNDTFPTAMHIAAYKMTIEQTVPALKRLQKALDKKSRQWHSIVKIGRTHLEDATPLTVGQEWSGYAAALGDAITEVEHATSGLLRLAMGGTAVGTGLNSPEGFGDEVAAVIAKLTGYPFQTAENKFAAQGTLDRMVRAHAGLKAAAVTLFKIANDMRWLGSGPRTGLMELISTTKVRRSEINFLPRTVENPYLVSISIYLSIFVVLSASMIRWISFNSSATRSTPSISLYSSNMRRDSIGPSIIETLLMRSGAEASTLLSVGKRARSLAASMCSLASFFITLETSIALVSCACLAFRVATRACSSACIPSRD